MKEDFIVHRANFHDVKAVHADLLAKFEVYHH